MNDRSCGKCTILLNLFHFREEEEEEDSVFELLQEEEKKFDTGFKD